MTRLGERIQAIVRIRRDLPGKTVRPQAEAMEGKPIRASFGWVMSDGDPYPGEVAWVIDREDDTGRLTWIAEGDLADVLEIK